MYRDISPEELDKHLDAYFAERKNNAFMILNKSLLAWCIKDPVASVDLKNQNPHLQTLVADFEKWIILIVRKAKITKLIS